MSKNRNNIRQVHVSPGIYQKETDITVASRSLGITSLGLVGETLKGPAFQLIEVKDWREYKNYFGGTNPEKFKGSGYPKYELPYIAQSYLKESNNLKVVRVLGLSGVNAGPAWVITVSKYDESGDLVENSPYNDTIIAVIRSRGGYKKAAFVKAKGQDECNDVYEFDKLQYYAKEVYLERNKSFVLNRECKPEFSEKEDKVNLTPVNFGRFTLVVRTIDDEIKRYEVSLNPHEKNYIYNVIGGNPEKGDNEIFIEELYDIALKQLVEKGEVTAINGVNPSEELQLLDKNGEVTRKDNSDVIKIAHYPNVNVVPKFSPVLDLLTNDEGVLRKSDIGKRYLFSKSESINSVDGKPLKVHVSEDNGLTWVAQEGQIGHIYTVIAHTTESGRREYYYGEYVKKIGNTPALNTPATEGKLKTEALSTTLVKPEEPTLCREAVEVLSDNMFYILKNDEVRPVTFDINNYKEQFRSAMTPWIVSEMKGNGKNVELTKLFRFHTISDGESANTEVKISIENIEPSKGTFDVLVRNYHDTDYSIQVLERFSQCNLVVGDKNYIGYKIGSTNGEYEAKSKYVTVEVNENEKVKSSIPSGFLGYPIRDYQGAVLSNSEIKVKSPYIRYNTRIDEENKISKQYFGLSDIVGIDTDVLKYKGSEAYNGLPRSITPCFHLDSRIINGKPDRDGVINDGYVSQKVTVDGIGGFEWVTVAKNNVTSFGIEPRIGTDEVMLNTIYEDKAYRKFSVAFYGGFDGWDYYRSHRTNTDEFSYQKYRGEIDTNSGAGHNFSIVKHPEKVGLEKRTKVLNSDFYAYLGAISQFSNPKVVDINLLATPGIDIHNNKLLVNEVIDIVETRADTLYIPTIPDKPFGSSDTDNDGYTASEVVDILNDTEIDTNYAAAFFPWVKYEDKENNVYVYLPVTKDFVRNAALTDNISQPWISSQGFNRGIVEGIKPRIKMGVNDHDLLYANRINYINTFSKEGMRLWGDKNLQVYESQMNRISKRRLLIRVRKLCSIACIGLLFDPNDSQMSKTLHQTLQLIMDDLVSKRGVSEYKIEIEDTPEMRDRLTLGARIFMKPIGMLEYITLDFIITPQGVSFTD